MQAGDVGLGGGGGSVGRVRPPLGFGRWSNLTAGQTPQVDDPFVLEEVIDDAERAMTYDDQADLHLLYTCFTPNLLVILHLMSHGAEGAIACDGQARPADLRLIHTCFSLLLRYLCPIYT